MNQPEIRIHYDPSIPDTDKLIIGQVFKKLKQSCDIYIESFEDQIRIQMNVKLSVHTLVSRDLAEDSPQVVYKSLLENLQILVSGEVVGQ